MPTRCSSPGRALSGLLLTAALLMACSSSSDEQDLSSTSTTGTQVEWTLKKDEGLPTSAEWQEALLFSGGCPDEESLASGEFPQPLASRRAPAGEDSNQLVATFLAEHPLPEGRYGFALLIRASDCSIPMLGCVSANVPPVKYVRLNLYTAYDPPEGACQAPMSCQQGQCAP